MIVYIINGCVTINNIDDRPHHGYLMGYTATTGVIIYWKPDQNFFIHRVHNVWFDEYNYCIPIEDKHTPGYLLLQQYIESLLHNQELLNFIPCELDLISTTFFDISIITYEIELPPAGNKLVLIYWTMNILHPLCNLYNPKFTSGS